MKPYARNNRKIRINNRRKFNSASRRISWEFSPKGYIKVVPLILIEKRLKKAKRQGITKDCLSKYMDAMT